MTPRGPARDALDRAALEGLLARLDAFRDHPTTVPVHDALYRLVQALRTAPGGEAAGLELDDAREVAELPHPLQGELRALLDLGPAPAARRLERILALQPGMPQREDPLEALEIYLGQLRDRIAILERRGRELEAGLQRHARLLSLATGVCVLAFAAALLLATDAAGWLGPLGRALLPGEPARGFGADEQVPKAP